MTKTASLALIVFLGVLNFAAWGWFNRPVPVDLSFDEAFPSVSFAPFRRGQGPITRVFPTPAQIEDDIKSLVGVARGIRTYTSLEGLDIVPELARKYGIDVIHSAWLGQKRDNNDLEMEALIKAANAHPDVIKRVIVGNEVLLRQDLPVDELIKNIRHVRGSVKQPVSYADVWAFWLKNPQVAKEVDFITVHILPYWEDEPIAVEHAARQIVDVYRRMAETFPGKPILIGEAGWPTRGRTRGPAVANMENAARFVRTLALVSKEHGFDYNVVEAFDQPWKAKLEGTVGAKWGVVDENRRVKYRMSGPVEPSPSWPWHGALSSALGMAAGWWFLRRAEGYSPKGAVMVALLAQGLSALALWQALNAFALAYDWGEDVWAYVRILAHGALAWIIVKAAGEGFARDGLSVKSRWGEWLVAVYGFSAISISVLLLFNGRYRDIPPLEFLVPCVGLSIYGAGRATVLGLSWREAFAVSRLFGRAFPGGVCPTGKILVGLLVSVVISPFSELVALARGEDFVVSHPSISDQLPLLIQSLWENREMGVWTVMLAVMVMPFLAQWSLERQGKG